MDTILHAFTELTYSDIYPILTLIVLEGLLSADNALVIAVLVKDLKDEREQKMATKVGMLFAYLFRFIAVFFIGPIMGYSFIRYLAAFYLLYLAYHGLSQTGEEEKDTGFLDKILGKFKLSPFVKAIIAVELADIVFSIDSIAAAIAFSPKLAVVFIAGCLGILAMRFAANLFLSLLNRYPILNPTAFVLVGIIGFKMVLTAGEFPGFWGMNWFSMDVHVPHWLATASIFGTFFGALGMQHWAKKYRPNSAWATFGSASTTELKEEIEMQKEQE